jgi:hypothetical protein
MKPSFPVVTFTATRFKKTSKIRKQCWGLTRTHLQKAREEENEPPSGVAGRSLSAVEPAGRTLRVAISTNKGVSVRATASLAADTIPTLIRSG